MFIDTHAHIHQHDPNEIPGIVERAVGAGVGAIITAGVTVEDSEKALSVAEKYPQVFAGVGLHPADLAAPLTPDDLAHLSRLALSPRVVVMSEIGIDHQRQSPDKGWQEAAFQEQIEVARQHNLAIVFHIREQGDDYDAHSARDTALSILKETSAGELGGTAHYFQGRWSYASQLIDLGFHISFAKTLTRIPDLEETAIKTPLDRILVETDAYPQPFKKERSKWTEPRDITGVAEKLAALRGTTIHEIQKATTTNALTMLGNRSSIVGAVLESFRSGAQSGEI
ncbi:MAG: TatD family hydrolase [Chloroflexi bacterium]|nr:TatD family hydrolase [Chloroflexota bacterium]